ncbi:MAG: hypothetical protein H6599_05180 [Flavobacteriales bacterium]|nr:hypothetical protein [Flavobacteriales bacterium]
MKNRLRIILLVVGGFAGGYLVDNNMNSKFPIFTFAFPLGAAAIIWRINSEMNDSE